MYKRQLLLLFGLFILIEGIRKTGVIDAAAQLFYTLSGDDPFRLYTMLVFVSVGLSAFIDNIPYVATMLPVVQGIAAVSYTHLARCRTPGQGYGRYRPVPRPPP